MTTMGITVSIIIQLRVAAEAAASEDLVDLAMYSKDSVILEEVSVVLENLTPTIEKNSRMIMV